MRMPPLPIVLIVVLDLVAASSSFFVFEQIGVVAACAEFVLFSALAVGLWQLKKWAWYFEIVLGGLQIAVLLAGTAIAILVSANPGSPLAFMSGTFVAVIASLIVLNAIIIIILAVPKVKSAFQ